MAQFNRLSNREQQVVGLLLQGKSNKLIALSLGISDRTVEFHLNNVYTKFQVNSRIELILKLGHASGNVDMENLGFSTVERLGKKAENRIELNSRKEWGVSIIDGISMIGKDLQKENFLNTKYMLVGVITSLFTGFLWVALLSRFGHMSLNEIAPWILPLFVILAIIGLSLGLIGKRRGSRAGKVFFSTLLGTGLGAFLMLPLTAIFALPLGKLAERLGWIDRAALPSDVASILVIASMLAMWLISGKAIGVVLLYVKVRKPGRGNFQIPAPDQGLS